MLTFLFEYTNWSFGNNFPYNSIVLHQLYQGNSTYRVGNNFLVSTTTVAMFTIEVYQILINHFYSTYIKIANDKTLQLRTYYVFFAGYAESLIKYRMDNCQATNINLDY